MRHVAVIAAGTPDQKAAFLAQVCQLNRRDILILGALLEQSTAREDIE
jgi:hypothetical protein